MNYLRIIWNEMHLKRCLVVFAGVGVTVLLFGTVLVAVPGFPRSLSCILRLTFQCAA